MFTPATAAVDASAATDAAGAAMTGAGAEGTDINQIVVVAERNKAAATAPTKASLEQTQPEAIISHQFIEQVTPETGGWTTVINIAPSVSGITSNGGGVGDYNVVTIRSFKDGQFNVTYDGIAFGDTNDPTHHGGSYWPTSTIGAAVVDRGPGAAGDLGQENYGGALHFFSPNVTDKFGVDQKVTYGSFNTWGSVTTLNTGTLPQLGGGKLLLNFDEQTSTGELSHSNGVMYNQLAKFVLPIGEKAVLTFFADHQFTHFNFEDSAGPGETWQRVQLYGKNFFMTADPTSEHFYGYNFENKRTDFEYVDLKYQITPTVALENQGYTYYYSNKTISANDLTGLIGGPNTSFLQAKGANKTDIGGYDKLNQYRVAGDIIRFNKDWSFGTLKLGGVVETSQTQRHNCFVDLSTGRTPDLAFTPTNDPLITSPTNCKLQENSSWLQGQFFVDFNWHPTEKLTISPGFKYVDFTRNVNAADEKVGGATNKNGPLVATNNYQSPLYFLTANYKIKPDWAVYGQFATGFVVPSLSALYSTGANLQNLKPSTTTNYQIGTVYTHGPITADVDGYLIYANNLEVQCSVQNPPGPPEQAFCNAGSVRYDGVEAEAAYAFDFGLTLFVNGSYNLNNSNILGVPLWTDAVGAIYNHGRWAGSLTYKQSGTFVAAVPPVASSVETLPGYDSLDASVSYDFGHFKIKAQGFNLLNKRAVTSYTAGSNANGLFAVTGFDGHPDQSIYTFQAGQQFNLTLEAKF